MSALFTNVLLGILRILYFWRRYESLHFSSEFSFSGLIENKPREKGGRGHFMVTLGVLEIVYRKICRFWFCLRY